MPLWSLDALSEDGSSKLNSSVVIATTSPRAAEITSANTFRSFGPSG